MEQANYAAIARLEAENWWYVSRRNLVRSMLRRYRAGGVGADLGCGVGSTTGVLGEFCDEVMGIDASAEAVAFCRDRGLLVVREGDLTNLDLPDASLDVVLCLDVLEHVDDGVAMEEIRRLLKGGGLLIVSVPAHRFLWNENDTFSHHLRRYSLGDVRTLGGSFDVLDLGYWNITMFLPVLLYTLLRRITGPGELKNNLDRLPAVVNRPLCWALWLENRVRRWVPMPIGTSIVAALRR